jgi:hypothetical protein
LSKLRNFGGGLNTSPLGTPLEGGEVVNIRINILPLSSQKSKVKVSSPVTGLEWPRGFQEVKVPTFLDNGTVW